MRKTGPDNCSNFILPENEDEAIILRDSEVHAYTHPKGDKEVKHHHNQNHTIFVRSGRMRWCLRDSCRDLSPGDVFVAPAGMPHSFEVLGNKDARVMCIISPRPQEGEPPKYVDK